MVSLKVWNGSALKDPDMIIAKGSTDTLFEVNYVVVNNSSQTPVTVWQAISQTTRSTTTTFDTSQSTTTTFDTSNATTTTFSTSNSTTTTFNTSKSTTTSFNTSRSTTTSFNTSRSTTTSFNTSRSTTTSFNTSRSTSRTTSGSYTPYYVSVSTPYYGLFYYTTPYPVYWNETSTYTFQTPWSGNSGATFSYGGYTYQVSTSPPTGALMYGTMYKIRRYLGPYSTSYTTTFGTSRSTTTTFGTSRSTTTTFGTSRSTTTTFGTSKSTTTTFSTSNSTTTTFNTSSSTTTTFSTSNSTTTTFSTSTATDTTIFVRLTGTLGGATSTETEVASADATNVRYWDGDSWEED